jgi:hypothetical protein
MNKFILVLLLALVSCGGFSLGEGEVPVDDIYAAVVALFRGLAETDEATCAGVLESQKDKILEIVYAAIDEVKAGADVSTAAQNALIKLMGVDGLVSECNVLAMPAIITKVTSKDGLVDIFQALIDNIDDVYSYGEDIKAAFDEKDYNAAAEAFGHILAIALDFQVNL